ncbi:hypothetical protein [Pedobacter frigiditerrae]|uniref:hypothetical protein n=1 Tax=Pedobacter frigiditerrae TaxID=2530452 RepID=UPI00293059E2|nr:hypothetical protein [Pedobacter frigiditerrae]
MIKKLNFSRILLMASFFVLFALSCKKELANENPLEEAKNYYLNLTANAKTSLKSNKETTQNVTTDFLWNKSRLFKFSDEKEVVGTPVKVTLSNGKEAPGSYLLLVYKKGNEFNSLIIYNAKNDYFNGVVCNSDIEAAFMVGQKNKEIKSFTKNTDDVVSKVSKGKTMVRDGSPPVCIDWYWTTYAYDDWGNIIEIISEVYLYTTCTEEDGGGGGGVDPIDPDDELNCSTANQEADASTASQNISSSIETSSADTRTKTYKWKFLENAFGLWNYTSTERGTHKKVGAEWRWEKLEHVIHGRNGTVLVASITVSDVVFEPTVGIYNAGATLYFNFDSSFICKGVPGGISFSTNVNSPVWNIDY